MVGKLFLYWISLSFWSHAPKSMVRRMQIRRFNSIYSFARKESKFYSDLYAKSNVLGRVDNLDDIKTLPIVSKEQMRQVGFDSVIPPKYDRSQLVYCTTSGSTGTPFDIAYTKYSNLTGYVRVYYIMKKAAHYSPFKKMTILSKYEKNKEFNVEKNVSYIKILQDRIGLFSRQLVSISDSPKSIYSQIKKYGPHILYSSSSAVDYLANYLETNGLELSIPAIVLIAEPLSQSQFTKFKKVFHSTIIDIYGALESPSLGYEVDKEGVFHLFPNSALVETIDVKETEFGKKGTIVVTNLINQCQPFIRYNLNDFVDVDDDAVDDITIGHIVGRVNNVLTLPDGRPVFYFCISKRYMDFHKALQYKFLQVGGGPITMQILPNPEYTLSEIEKEAKHLWNLSYCEYPLNIEFVNHFDVDAKTGKFKVIDHIESNRVN